MPEPVIIKVGADLSELTAKLESIQSQLDELKGTARQPGEELRKSFTGATGAMNEVKMSAKQLDAEIRAVTESMKKTNDPKAIAALKEYRQELIQEEQQLGKTTQKFESMRGKIMAIKNELFKLRAEGKQGTQRFQELTVELARLGNMKDDINELGRALSSDTRHIDGMIQGVQGLVGAFSIFQGVQMLVGSENKDFQKAMLKMMATMQILNGVQQVANILQKESAFRQTMAVALSKIFTTQKIAETTATEGAEVAQKALNTTMKANPIGIVVTALAALVTALIVYGQQVSDVTKIENDWVDANAEIKKKYAEQTQSIDTYLSIAKNVNKSEEQRLLALKKLREETGGVVTVTDLSSASLKKLDSQTNIYLETLYKQIKLEAARGKIIDLQKSTFDLQAEAMKITNEIYDKNITQLTASLNPLDAAKMGFKSIADLLKGEVTDVYKRVIDFRTKDINEQIKQNALLEKGLLIYVNQNTVLKDDTKEKEKNTKATKDQTKATEDNLKTISDYYSEVYRMSLDYELGEKERLKKIAAFERDTNFNKKAEEIALLKGTDEEKKELLDEYRDYYDNIYIQKLAELNKESVEDVKKTEEEKTEIIENEYRNRAKIASENITKTSRALSDAVSLYTQFQQQQTDEQLRQINRVHDTQIEQNQDALDKGLMSQEQFDKKKKQLDEQQEKRIRDANRKAFNQQKAASLVQATIKGVVATLELVGQGGWAGLAAGLALIAGEIALIASAKNPYRAGTAQILNGNSHEGGGISLGQFGTAEGGEMLGILSKKNTKKFGKPMLELFDGINKGNDSKMLKGLSGLVVSAIPEIKQGNQVVNVPKQPELSEMLQIMKKPQETVTIIGNKKIIKQGNYTRIVHL